MNALAALLIAWGLGMLDRRLDGWIDESNLSGAQKEQLHKTEDELIEELRRALKASSPRIVKLLSRAVPNDPSTGVWGG